MTTDGFGNVLWIKSGIFQSYEIKCIFVLHFMLSFRRVRGLFFAKDNAPVHVEKQSNPSKNSNKLTDMPQEDVEV